MAYHKVNGKLVKVVKTSNKKHYNPNWEFDGFSVKDEEHEQGITIMSRLSERMGIDSLSTGERHSEMCKLAKTNPRKGVKGGDCNVTQCQKSGASSFNPPMRAWYCYKCASDMHKSSLSYGEEPFIRPEDLHADFTFKYEGE